MSRWVYWASLAFILVMLGIPGISLLTRQPLAFEAAEPITSDDIAAKVADDVPAEDLVPFEGGTRLVVDIGRARPIFKLGLDLAGGTSLIYQLRAPERGEIPDPAVVRRIILKRIDPTGVRGYTVRQHGATRIEIIVPARRAQTAMPLRDVENGIADAVHGRRLDNKRFRVFGLEEVEQDGRKAYTQVAVWTSVDPENEDALDAWREAIRAGLETNPDVEDVKRLVGQAGFLQFRIVADRFQDRDKVAGGDFENIVNLKKAGRPSPNDRFQWYPVSDNYYERLTEHGIPDGFIAVHDEEAQKIEVLVDVGDGQDITGEDLASARPSSKATGEPIVEFSIKPRSQTRMARLTKRENYGRAMAIILDGEVQSAPTLGGRRPREDYQPLASGGIIEGYASTAERDRVLQILQSGNLGANLGDPVFERTVGPELGEDNIRKGLRAIGIGLVLVLIFMVVYYRFAGLVADVALLLNLGLVVSVLFIADQAWTLPGIAGLILTVGMSVDANVLIFERIREEKGREGSLAFAVGRAYSRAFRTILDANITTLIPAVFLYALATEEVQGFAIVIIVGIAMSMFTALLFTRMIFEAGMQAGWVKNLKMRQWVRVPRVDWMRLARRAVVVSGVLIVAGAMYFYTRGPEKYDIEFTGGTQVDLALDVPEEAGVGRLEQVRARVADTFGPEAVVQKLDVEARPGEEDLSYYRISVAAVGEGGEKQQGERQVRARLREAFAHMWPEVGAGVRVQAEASEITVDLIRQRLSQERGQPEEPEGAPAPEADPGEGYYFIPAEMRQFMGTLRLQFSANVALTEQEVRAELLRFLRDRHSELADTEIRVRGTTPADQPGRFRAFDAWVAVSYEGRYAGASNPEFWKGVLDGALGQREFLSVTSFEATMAAETWQKAVLVIIGSLGAIVFYIWLRFAKLSYGLAAVVALVHDVFIVLGAVAITAAIDRLWTGNWLLITDMKINLPMVGAFLTLIGYSLNDTIVVFDRIRENRGKFGDLSEEVTNRSINQTLTRTIWTSLTTFLVVMVLYVLGGTASTLHGFSYVLTLGVIVGTYSSMAIASPVLVLRGYLMRVYAIAYPMLALVVTVYFLASVGFAASALSWAIVIVWLVWMGVAAWGTHCHANDRPWPLLESAPWLAKGAAGAGLIAPPVFVAMLLVVQFAPEGTDWAAWAGPMAVGALFSMPAMVSLYRSVWGSFFEKG
jgi:SecD/SecF fusion protein